MAPAAAADVVAMVANKDFGRLAQCPACGFTASVPRGRLGHRGGSRSGSGSPHGPRSASSGPVAPKYGRKIFITDDTYVDRRASRLAAWERAGAIRHMPPSTHSPSAPLPEKAPRWRTVDSSRCLEAELTEER